MIKKTKLCTKCKADKALDMFSKCRSGIDGLQAWCKACKKACQKVYRQSPKGKASMKVYRQSLKRKALQKIYQKAYIQSPKGRIFQKAYRRSPKAKAALKKLRATPAGKLNHNMSVVIRKSLKGNKNGRHWEATVGYTLKQLKRYLEKRFTKGMSWENYGEWHLDHEIPISVFNFKTPEHEDFKRCWALSNLQPMWAKENISKSNELTKHFQPSLMI